MKKIFLIIFFISIKFNLSGSSLQWAKRIGGNLSDEGCSIAVDNEDNIYVAGNFRSIVDFDPDSAIYNLTSYSTIYPTDIFIAKFNATGDLIWAKQMGPQCNVAAITLDSMKNIYLTGTLYGNTDFDPGPGIQHVNVVGYHPMFVCKLDSQANFIWVKGMGGYGGTYGIFSQSIAVDAIGNIYTTGYFNDTVDFDPGPTINKIHSNGYQDIFISKLDANGDFVWVKTMGGNYNDVGCSIQIDSSGNVFTAGYCGSSSVDINPGSGIQILPLLSSYVGFILKLDSYGNFIWAKSLAPEGNTQLLAFFLDNSGNIYTSGTYGNTADFDPGVGTQNLSGSPFTANNIFITKFTNAGDYIWAKSLITGIGSANKPRCLKVDGKGNVYSCGYFGTTLDFDPSIATYNLTTKGGSDGYILKLDSIGDFIWAKQIGNIKNDFCESIVLNAAGILQTTGYSKSNSIFPIPFTFTNADTSGQTSDVFIAKFGECDAFFTTYASPTPHSWFAINQSIGVPPLTYSWNWGDGTPVSNGITPSHVYSTAGYYTVCLNISDSIGCISTFCDVSHYLYKETSANTVVNLNVILPGTVDILEEEVDQNKLWIYPNPARNEIAIHSPNNPIKNIEIYTLLGEKAFSLNSFIPEQEKEYFNIQTLESGVYFLKVQTSSFSTVRKLIIEK